MASRFPQARAVGHALAGHALIGLGRGEAEVGKELEEARRELDSVPGAAPGLIPRRAQVEPWIEALRGERLLRAGRLEEGRKVIEEVARAMRATPGPDAWTQSLFRLETMARTAREAGDWELARFLAAQMLDHDPAYGGSHLAQAYVLQHRGDAEGARREADAAKLRWRDADDDLAERRSGRPSAAHPAPFRNSGRPDDQAGLVGMAEVGMARDRADREDRSRVRSTNSSSPRSFVPRWRRDYDAIAPMATRRKNNVVREAPGVPTGLMCDA